MHLLKALDTGDLLPDIFPGFCVAVMIISVVRVNGWNSCYNWRRGILATGK